MNGRKLAQFTISQADGAFTLHLEDENGETLDMNATRGQLDIIADTLDDILDQTEDEDEVEEEEEDEDERS